MLSSIANRCVQLGGATNEFWQTPCLQSDLGNYIQDVLILYGTFVLGSCFKSEINVLRVLFRDRLIQSPRAFKRMAWWGLWCFHCHRQMTQSKWAPVLWLQPWTALQMSSSKRQLDLSAYCSWSNVILPLAQSGSHRYRSSGTEASESYWAYCYGQGNLWWLLRNKEMLLRPNGWDAQSSMCLLRVVIPLVNFSDPKSHQFQ